jgi:hypothetical protein
MRSISSLALFRCRRLLAKYFSIQTAAPQARSADNKNAVNDFLQQSAKLVWRTLRPSKFLTKPRTRRTSRRWLWKPQKFLIVCGRSLLITLLDGNSEELQTEVEAGGYVRHTYGKKSTHTMVLQKCQCFKGEVVCEQESYKANIQQKRV